MGRRAVWGTLMESCVVLTVAFAQVTACVARLSLCITLYLYLSPADLLHQTHS